MFGKFGAILDQYWMLLVAAIGAIMVAVPPMYFDRDHPNVLLVSAVILGAVLALWGSIATVNTIRELTRERDSALELGRAEQILLTGDVLGPTLERLHKVVSEGVKAPKRAAYGELLVSVLGESAGFLQPEGGTHVRVNYYRLKGAQGEEYLEVAEKTRSVRRDILDNSTPDGAAILSRTLRGDHEYRGNYLPATPSDDTALAQPTYKCFASVSVVAHGYVYGMLSANSDDSEGIAESAMPFLKVMGGVLAIAEKSMGEADPARVSKHLPNEAPV